MTYFDEEYIKLLKRILKEGEEVENRTGINTVKLPEHYFKFDLRDEYPILSTKQTFYTPAAGRSKPCSGAEGTSCGGFSSSGGRESTSKG